MDTEGLQAEYKRLRENRGTFSKVTSWLGARAGYAGQERDTIEEVERRLTARGVSPGSNRRQVTPDQFGYEEVGSAYRRASISFLSTQAAEEGTGSMQWLKDGVKTVGEMGGKSEPSEFFKAMLDALQTIASNTDKKAEVR